MDKISYHVVPSPEGGWSVRKAESERATKLFKTMKDAVDWAHKLSISQRSELVIHKQDGTVLSKETFQCEPIPVNEKGSNDPSHSHPKQ